MRSSTKSYLTLIVTILIASTLCAAHRPSFACTGAGTITAGELGGADDGAPLDADELASPHRDDTSLESSSQEKRLIAFLAAGLSDHHYDLLTATVNGKTDEVRTSWKGGDESLPYADGWTLLHCAVIAECSDLVEFFLAKKVPINAQTHTAKTTALHMAAMAGLMGFVTMLLRAGADLVLLNRDGKTAAMVAREKGHEEIAALIEG